MTDPNGRSSRTTTHSRPVLVFPVPGASTGTVMSSACSTCPARTWRPMASASGVQQEHRLADPVSQSRAIEFDAFTGVDAGLAVQRHMVAELRHQNLREQARARPTAFNRQAGHRRLHDRLASTTAQLRADMTDHLEAGGDV